MSVIHQALKKAQREQLRRESHLVPGARHRAMSVPTRRWPWLLIGCIAASGVGAGAHLWATLPGGPRPAALPVAETSHPSETPVVSMPPEVGAVVPTPGGTKTSAQSPAPGVSRAPLLLPHLSATAHTLAVATLVAPPPLLSGPSVPAPALLSAPSTAPAGGRPASAIPVDPGHARTVYAQAVVAQDAGQTERALMLFHQAITFDPTLKIAYNSLGSLYYQQQQYQQALTLYQQALTIDPQYVKARNNLGSTYLRLAMDERAREEFTKALVADSSYGLAHYNLACVSARAGDSTATARHLQRAMALEPQARLWAQTDEDFTRVRTTRVVRQLLEP